ncbi:DUF4214 domain-containing protein ['Massilia aquatica' Lu et al. 2020]|uniref:DUF4214 domain-containing protein n=1 Tax=Pseudoduganella aquatica TaxID=2660641 RepID=A0A7X4HEJ6_9BURK|nr:DUF4214 domain-containing protein [Pseudoduganella aquatica]MYN09781.1 DUF4214 domain-containing protein [Pseudoduganella aquatica]
MTIHTWQPGETKTITFAAGDSIDASGIAASALRAQTLNGALVLDAAALGALTLRGPGGAALQLDQLKVTLSGGGRLLYTASGSVQAGNGGDFLLGGALDNTLYGGAGNDTLDGGDGNDKLYAYGGNDTVYGGAGNDTLDGGGGTDKLDGGDGDDYLQSGQLYDNATGTFLPDLLGDILNGGAGKDTIFGSEGNDVIDGGSGNDKLYARGGNDTVSGGDGDDEVFGEAGDDVMSGGAGNDKLYAGAGKDTIYGGDGDDELWGEDGDDTLDGGAGANLLLGGSGDDSYIIRSRLDRIQESSGQDKGVIYADWYKTNSAVEQWTWAPGVQKLPYWIDALTYESAFTTANTVQHVVYYSFAQAAASFFTTTDLDGFHPFNAEQKSYALQAMAYASSLLNVRFVETASADTPYSIVFGYNRQPTSGGYAASIYGGHASVLMVGSTKWTETPSTDNGKEMWRILLHELGHSLGLKHPFDLPPAVLPAAEDKTSVTVMSYTEDRSGSDSYHVYAPFDIAALQALYGVAPQAHAGDSVYALDAGASSMIWDGGGSDTIDGSALKQDLTLYLEAGYWSHIGAKAATITAPGQVTINFGSDIENGFGGAGNDRLTGNALDNRLAGAAGNDVLTGGAGNDRMDGGAGLDTASYAGARAGYTLQRQNGAVVLSDKTGADGVDTLSTMERLKFSDTMVALDVGAGETGGLVYRLYQAAFDRQPDLVGLGYWIAMADQGLAMRGIASSFIGSQEFTDRYGAKLSNETFVAQLYQNVLHRPYEQAGFDYWTGVLKLGVTREDVLLGFADSGENYAQLAVTIGDGFAYTPYG